MPSNKPCPHCQGSLESLPRHRHVLLQCQRCRFVFPVVRTWRTQRAAQRTGPSDRAPSQDLIVGASRYRALRKLGGRQAEVYLVHHVHLDQLCVIKVIDAYRTGGEVAVGRLMDEARAGYRVAHPNVVRVLDCDRLGDRCYVVMEYVSGIDLAAVQKRLGRLVWQQVAQIAVQAAEGLDAIHDAGLLHGDIKPSNLLLCPNGAVKISDLGLVQSRLATLDAGEGGPRTILGTPQYMAPEQLTAGSPLDGRADLYALGASLYHLLVGHPPRGTDGILELIREPAKGMSAWPSVIADAVPDWVRGAIERCLAPQREERWSAAGEFAAEIRRDLTRLPGGALPSAPLTRPLGVAVLAFRNVSGRPQDDWIGDALAERVRSRLIESADVYVVDRGEFAKLLDRKTLPGHGSLQRQLRSVSRLLGATLVIQGSFEARGEGVHVLAEVVEPERQRVRFLARAAGSIEEILGPADPFARRVVEAMSLPRPDVEAEVSLAGGASSAKAQEKYTRAVQVFANGEYADAAKLAEEALGLDPGYFDPLSLIGGCHARLGQYDEALGWHRRAEEAATLSGNAYRLAEVLNNLGVMCYYKGEYALALDYLDRSKELESKRSLMPVHAKTWNNLGFVLLRSGQLEQAVEAFTASIELHRQLGSVALLVEPYNGLGNVLLQQGRYAEAGNYHRRALALAEELEERVNIGVAHMNLGRCNGLMQRYDAALVAFRRALDALKETSFWNGQAVVYEHLGNLYIQLDQPKEALEAIEKRRELARRHGNRRMEASAWEQKAHAHEKAGRTDQAMKCLQTSLQVSQRAAPFEDLRRYLEEVVSRTPFLRRTSVGE